MRDIVLIIHDIRSAHNVGSLLRTAEGLGVRHVYFTGYTPYPRQSQGDPRLPHIAAKLHNQIRKTALDAEDQVPWSVESDVQTLIEKLRSDNYRLIALEQSNGSTPLPDYKPTDKMALLLGREVEGIDPALIALCDDTIEIPMFGQKESFNVVQAAAMTLYTLRFYQD
jgi:tRNA G18 (ribose-2'-O)-methylase SpoU